jgi:DNA replication initiation complex subunit (GINS family)
MITYQELRKIQAKERDNPEIQDIGEDFIDRVVGYVHDKRNALKEMKEKDSVFSKDSTSEIQHELRNVLSIISDIYDRRQRKILSQVMISLKTDSLEDISKMMEFEKDIYEKSLSLLKKFRSEFFNKVMNGKPETAVQISPPTSTPIPTSTQELHTTTPEQSPTETIKKTQDEMISLKTTTDVPSFMWENGRTYGPFIEGDFVKLPRKIADILANSGKAIPAEEE